MKKKHYSQCTILRTFVRQHGAMNMATGTSRMTHSETVTEPCGTPLFGDRERATGVCRSCAKGWSVEENCFASDEERRKAAASLKEG